VDVAEFNVYVGSSAAQIELSDKMTWPTP
jgi:hypothetical protein